MYISIYSAATYVSLLLVYVCNFPPLVYVCMFVFLPSYMYVCIDWLLHGHTHWEPCGYQSFPHEFKELKVPQRLSTTTTTLKPQLYTIICTLNPHWSDTICTGQYNTSLCAPVWQHNTWAIYSTKVFSTFSH